MLRREFTKLASASPWILSLPLTAGAGSALAWYEEAAGLVLADPGRTDYSGAGYYLYPAWGKPRPYYVEQDMRGLRFLAPDSRRLLWQQPASPAMFAATVLQVVSPLQAPDVRQAYQPLRVPARPPA